MAGIIINPGSGPVDGGSREQAAANMAQFATDAVEIAGATSAVVPPQPDGDEIEGRFVFTIDVDGTAFEVEMPGLPLVQVRYLGAEGQNIWDFPRLYVDGDSWVWKYAIEIVANKDDEDEDDS